MFPNGLHGVGRGNQFSCDEELVSSILYACPILISGNHIRYAYRMCILAMHIAYAYWICLSDIHIGYACKWPGDYVFCMFSSPHRSDAEF